MLESETTEYKAFLESITTRELVKLADKAGIDIPPDLDRFFIIRELLDNVLDEAAPIKALLEKPSLKTVSLPLHYHITYMEVLPRDPQWVYVFWEIKAQDRERYEIDPRFEGYVLKALENKNHGENNLEKCRDSDFIESYTVPVGKDDNSWYLGFTGAGIFRVALCVQGLNISLVLSPPFVLPRFLNSPGNEEYLTRPLIQLSGVSDFTILKTADRVPSKRS